MLAFAGNSLLCRQALKHTAIDPATFTSIRILSGALVLWAITRVRGGAPAGGGNWPSAMALLAYAAGFSYAYVSLPAATGALLLFGAVQVTMIGAGLYRGERLSAWRSAGLACAFGGLAWMLSPGLSAPPIVGAALMLGAGVAWGIYSLRGRGAGDPLRVTTGNFARAAPIAVGLSAAALPWAAADGPGLAYAVLSGALTSGVGYAVWYTALRGLSATRAAAVQLSVPAIAAAGGVVFLGEMLTMRLVIASAAILGGIAMIIFERPASTGVPPSRRI